MWVNDHLGDIEDGRVMHDVEMERIGLEPMTFPLQTGCSPN